MRFRNNDRKPHVSATLAEFRSRTILFVVFTGFLFSHASSPPTVHVTTVYICCQDCCDTRHHYPARPFRIFIGTPGPRNPRAPCTTPPRSIRSGSPAGATVPLG